MKSKRIFFLHPAVKSVEDVRRYIKINERELGIEFLWDNENPEYLFVSECFYNMQDYRKVFFSKKYSDSVKIFFAGECIEPDLNLFDYAIVFDRDLKNRDRIGRIPLILFYMNRLVLGEQEAISLDVINSKTQFCNFIYSNANAHPKRDEIFRIINQYKKVDSLGSHLNNTENPYPRESGTWKETSIKLKSKYKFSIAAENAVFPGYTSEKIMTSFLAKSIPIYWGNPLVDQEFNPKAFINVENYKSSADLIEHIRCIDNDDSLWIEMANEPWQTEKQKELCRFEYEEYKEFIRNIFCQDKNDAKRCGEGTFPEIYKEWCYKKTSLNKDVLIKRMINSVLGR